MAYWRAGLTMTHQRIEQEFVYVAVQADQILGFYALVPTAQVYELDDLWIEPAWIGRGVGTLLFQHAVTLARAHGGVTLHLVADPHAVGFYQKMGMSKIGERPSVPAGRVLDVMVLHLAEP